MGSPSPTTVCPSCAAPASGRFCSECGAPLAAATCASCQAQLATGARFCHRCGTAVGGTTGTRAAAASAVASAPTSAPASAAAPRSMLPWGIAAVAFVALVALVLGQRLAASGNDGAAAAGALAGDPAGAPAGAPAAGPFAALPAECRTGGPPPDLSAMSPRDQADRLFDRVMRYAAEGKESCKQFFAPMARAAFQDLAPFDAHTRYDYGLLSVVTGDAETAAAQVDSILRENPNHLLGLILGARVAAARGDAAVRTDFERRLVAAESSERAKGLLEYQQHEQDIRSSVAEARRP